MKTVNLGSKILNVASILAGLMLINSGMNIFFHYMPMPKMSEELISVFGSLMHIKWLMPLVAVTEIAGGILFILPKTRAVGAIVLLPVLVGALIHHLTYDVSGGMLGYLLFTIIVFTMIDNREKYAPLIK